MEKGSFAPSVRLFSVLLPILRQKPLPALSPEEARGIADLAASASVLPVLAASEDFLSLCPEDVRKKLGVHLLSIVQKQTLQEFETKNITAALSRAGIRFLLLKGSVARRLYPRPEMRASGDVDILYDKKYRSEMRRLMEGCGFVRKDADPNHDVFKKGVVKVEMHHNLTQTEPGASYYADPWRLAEKKEGCEYAFSSEDFIAFHFLHAAKHFITGEMDFRMLTDLFLLRSAPFDPALLSEKLRSLRLTGFAERMNSLLDALSGKEPSPDDEDFFAFAFTERRDRSSSFYAYRNKKGGKFRYALSRAFPARSYMKEKYPAVAKCPPLLPFAWLYRLLRYLFGRKKSVEVDRPSSDAVAYFEKLGL